MFTDKTRADRPVDEVLSVANFYRKWSPPPHRVPVTHKDLQVNGHSHMVRNVILSVINSQYSFTCSDYCEGKSLIYEKSIMKKNLNFISWPMITFNGVDQILHTLNIIIIHTHGFFKSIIIYIKYNVPYLCIITCTLCQLYFPFDLLLCFQNYPHLPQEDGCK